VSPRGGRGDGNDAGCARAPLAALPRSLQRQIVTTRAQSLRRADAASKWMRPRGNSPDKEDLKSVLEKRIGAMR
jgi:hypothetical protein